MRNLRDIIDDILAVKGNLEAESMDEEALILERAVADLEEIENELFRLLHKMDKYRYLNNDDENEEVE